MHQGSNLKPLSSGESAVTSDSTFWVKSLEYLNRLERCPGLTEPVIASVTEATGSKRDASIL